MNIRAPKDFWSGIMFIAFAAVAMLTARGYSLGSAGRMGPGYFPMLLGGALAFLGLILVARSLVIEGETIGRLRPPPPPHHRTRSLPVRAGDRAAWAPHRTDRRHRRDRLCEPRLARA